MPKNQTLDEFYSTFREEVLCASDTETSGWTTEDFLTNVMMEYLEEAGEVTDPVICPFRGYGLQMNAYAISEDCESVDIFVSIYSESDRPRSVSQADIDAAIKRAIQLYHKAINDLYTAFQKDNDTYEFAITLHQNKDNIKHVRICALTNGLVKPIALKNITIGDAEISFGFIEKLVVFYLENSGHKITLYTKRWFALANHFFLCYNIFRYFSIFGGFLLTLNQYLL